MTPFYLSFGAIILWINLESSAGFLLLRPSSSPIRRQFLLSKQQQLWKESLPSTQKQKQQQEEQQQKHLAFCHHHHHHSHITLAMTSTSSTKTTKTTNENIETIKSNIITTIEPTKRGLSASSELRKSINIMVQTLEQSCSLTEPARDLRVEGSWEVLYTTAPPPSNGQLGPFIGVASQEIDLQTKRYRNILTVSPMNWLRAILDANWEEWDGALLTKDDDEENKNDGNDNNNNNKQQQDAKLATTTDYGATCWKVNFEMLTVQFFGKPLLSIDFAGNSRIWELTYLDDDTRIVRAGRTGMDEDAWLFYMKRN